MRRDVSEDARRMERDLLRQLRAVAAGAYLERERRLVASVLDRVSGEIADIKGRFTI
jgi:hypothetical protein